MRGVDSRPVGPSRCVLVTGATGKVGRTFLSRLLDLDDGPLAGCFVRALCHNRVLEPRARLEMVSGSLADRDVAERAVRGATHVVHLATTKESPDSVMDVAVKGLFFLLEACRASPAFEQFILVGGDASVGHFTYAHPIPVTEAQAHSAYPGCYALSKVLEETMLEQYGIQYDFHACCLRAPWIMEKDDFRCQLSFGDDVFGAPRWGELVGSELARQYIESGAVPRMIGADGRPVKRNFVHVDDLVDAMLRAIDHPATHRQTFNIAMDEPVDYGELAAHLARTRGLPSVDVPTPYFSTWLDNAKAKLLLGWRPKFDMAAMADAAFEYRRAPDDPRVVWYPG